MALAKLEQAAQEPKRLAAGQIGQGPVQERIPHGAPQGGQFAQGGIALGVATLRTASSTDTVTVSC